MDHLTPGGPTTTHTASTFCSMVSPELCPISVCSSRFMPPTGVSHVDDTLIAADRLEDIESFKQMRSRPDISTALSYAATKY